MALLFLGLFFGVERLITNFLGFFMAILDLSLSKLLDKVRVLTGSISEFSSKELEGELSL